MWNTLKEGGRLAAGALAAGWLWTADKVQGHPNSALAIFIAALALSFLI
jgi:hypothetical protein